MRVRLRGLARSSYLAVVRAECPPDAASFQDAILAHTERVLAGSPRHVRLLARLSLWLIGCSVLPRRIGRMGPGRLSARLLGMRHGRFAVLREAAAGVRAMALLAYYEQPEVQARLGYDPAAWIATVLDRREATYGVKRGVPGEDAGPRNEERATGNGP